MPREAGSGRQCSTCGGEPWMFSWTRVSEARCRAVWLLRSRPVGGMERAARTGKSESPVTYGNRTNPLLRKKTAQEKKTHKAPEPLPRRLRHFTGSQPGVSRLGSQTVAHRRTPRCLPLIGIVQKGRGSLHTIFGIRRVRRYRRCSQGDAHRRMLTSRGTGIRWPAGLRNCRSSAA